MKVGIVLTDYLRAGSTIGIIGGGPNALMLGIQAKTMGFKVNLLDPDVNCPAHSIADEFIQADYQDLVAIERLGILSDVVTYLTDDIDVEVLSNISYNMNLPQSLDALALLHDKLLMKGFLEDCGVNVLPYATIVQMTDIEEKIDGIGYPCYLEETRGKERIYLTSPADMTQIMDLVRQGTCILEADLPDARRLSVTVARNEQGNISTFPVVEHHYQDNRLLETIACTNHLGQDLQDEIKRIGILIAEKLENRGVITIDFLVAETGLILVDSIIPIISEKTMYTKDGCAISSYEAHLRSLCDWPLMTEIDLKQDVIIYHAIARELSLMQRQIHHQPTWKFYFYSQNAILLSSQIGCIVVLVKDFDFDYENLHEIML